MSLFDQSVQLEQIYLAQTSIGTFCCIVGAGIFILYKGYIDIKPKYQLLFEHFEAYLWTGFTMLSIVFVPDSPEI